MKYLQKIVVTDEFVIQVIVVGHGMLECKEKCLVELLAMVVPDA
jgi:hypothetical protein